MFNPFEKPIEQVTLEDILTLKEKNISEGMYVEYKSDFPNNVKISHSLASFANTHGGWYFIGIADDENNVPLDFNGFSLSDHTNPKEKIRDISRDHIDPIPSIQSNLVKLDEEKGILVIFIQESDETPHICKDGTIYRRSGEGSDPIAESDRYAIDRLYDKSKNFEKTIERFCQNDLTISKTQENQGWLEVYVMTHPFQKFMIKDFFDEKNRKCILELLKGKTDFDGHFSAGMDFNTIHSSTNSLIFRNMEPETVPFVGLSYIPYFNGNCKIIIPLPYVQIKTPVETKSKFEEAIYSKINEEDLTLFKIINGFNLIDTFLILLTKHIEYLKLNGWKDDLILKYRFDNTWRNILMLDSDAFIKQIEENGLPVCQQNEGVFPPNMTRGSLIYSMPDKSMTSLAEFNNIAEYFGIFKETFTNSMSAWVQHLIQQSTKSKTSKEI